ncbi:MAG: hypothetical protein LBG59_07935 [Candidatus Peribacteria bacterium]|nr:hypothetical protein [Candidatus Peribacteria bacterium]
MTDTRLTKAFLSMAQNTDLLTEAISMANQEREDNIALNKEAEQRYATNESKLIMLNNQYANQVEILGKGLLPISVRRKELLVGVTEAINDVL